MQRKYRREPRAGLGGKRSPIEHFLVTFKPRISDLSQFWQGTTLAKKIHESVGSGTGEGHLLLFPLTNAAPAYEIAKGILHVLAPQAQTRTIVTPALNYDHYMKNQKTHLSKLTLLNPTNIHLVDYVHSVNTRDTIQQALAQLNYNDHLIVDDELFYELNRHAQVIRPFVSPSMHGDFNGRFYWEKESNGKKATNAVNARWVTDDQRRLGETRRTGETRDLEQVLYQIPHKKRRLIALARRHYYNLGIAYAKEYLARKEKEKMLR